MAVRQVQLHSLAEPRTVNSTSISPPAFLVHRKSSLHKSIWRVRVLAASVETTFTNADLTNLFQIAMPGSAVRVTGRANGTIKASGNLLDEDAELFARRVVGYSELSPSSVSASKTFSSTRRRLWLSVLRPARWYLNKQDLPAQAPTSCSTARSQPRAAAGRISTSMAI